MNINEKFFRVEKLKFLAPLTRLLGQRELRTRCCPERPKMTFKHFIGVYYMNISHVGPLWGLFRYPRGAQKGPFGLKKTLTGRKASEHPRGARFGPNCCQLVWLSWNHGYHTLWPCIGPLLGPQGHQKGPFWPEMPLFGVTEVLGEQIWSTLPPIGLTGLKSWLPHTLALYQASSGPPGTPKGPVLALNAPFGPQKGPNRAQIQNCCKPIMWPIKICARKALSQWKTPKHNLVYQLRENSKKLPFRALTGPQSLLEKKLYFWVTNP